MCRLQRCCGVRPKSSSAPITRGIRTSPCHAISSDRSGKISRGIEFGERAALDQLLAAVAEKPRLSRQRLSSTARQQQARPAARQPDRPDHTYRKRHRCDGGARERSDHSRAAGIRSLEQDAARKRAEILEKAAMLLEQRRAHFIALLQREGGKTLDDALSKSARRPILPVLCRRGTETVGAATPLPGPTGESNMLQAARPCVFVLRYPVEFSAAIFMGQITAALMAGNAVVAKTRRTDAVDRGGGYSVAA